METTETTQDHQQKDPASSADDFPSGAHCAGGPSSRSESGASVSTSPGRGARRGIRRKIRIVEEEIVGLKDTVGSLTISQRKYARELGKVRATQRIFGNELEALRAKKADKAAMDKAVEGVKTTGYIYNKRHPGQQLLRWAIVLPRASNRSTPQWHRLALITFYRNAFHTELHSA